MSKRQTEPDLTDQASKKPKTSSGFRSAVPKIKLTPTVNEPISSSSGSISRSTVVTLSKSDDGRRHASGRYRNRQDRPSTQLKDQFPDPGLNKDPSGIPDSSEDQSATGVPPEPEGVQDTTETSKTKRQRNNNNSVSHKIILSRALFLTSSYH
jgi:hypothetical protein